MTPRAPGTGPKLVPDGPDLDALRQAVGGCRAWEEAYPGRVAGLAAAAGAPETAA